MPCHTISPQTAPSLLPYVTLEGNQMAQKVLTAAAVKRLNPPARGQVDHFDAALPGFALRISYKGTKSWVILYRFRGKLCRLTIGRCASLSLADAREKAQEKFRLVERGIDPKEEEASLKALSPHPPDTFGAVADLFIERYAKRKNKGWRETERIFEKYVKPVWGHYPLAEINRADVVRLLDQVEDNNGIYMANRVLAAVRKLFNWALVERSLIETTPIVPGMNRGKETARDRVLKDDEVKSLWSASESLGAPFGPWLKFLLITGQRRGEVASMKWSDLSDDMTLWTLAAENSKSNRKHEIPLPQLAVDLLSNLPHSGDYIFSSGKASITEKSKSDAPKKSTDRPVSGFSKTKKRLDGLIKKLRKKNALPAMGKWVFHDLRRTAASNMAKMGVPRLHISKVLNHADPSVTAVYDRHSYIPEKTRALNAWAQMLEGIISPDENSNVVPINA